MTTHICEELNCTEVAIWAYRHEGSEHYVCSAHQQLVHQRLAALGFRNELAHNYVPFTRLWIDPGPAQRQTDALNFALGEIERLKPYESLHRDAQEQIRLLNGQLDATKAHLSRARDELKQVQDAYEAARRLV